MVVKGNEIIEKRNVVNEIRRNNMSLQELRFFSIYLSKINARDINTRKVRFQLTDFQKIMDFGRLNINQLKATTNGLLGKVINIPNERGGYTGFQLFKKCTVDQDDVGVWYVEIDAHDDALPLMFDFKKEYFTYELWNALQLRSNNQIRMYEILKQYENIGERNLSLIQLRELLGVDKKEYPRWDRFKERVIDSCRQALTEYTDISFTYDPIKSGRGGKIVGIKFYIQKNKNFKNPLSLNEFINLQPDSVGQQQLIDTEYILFSSEDNFEEIEESKYKSKKLEFLAEACNNEFSELEMQVILDLIVQLVPYGDYPDGGVDNERYRYLLHKYNELNCQASKNKENGKPIKNRFSYLKKILESDIKKEKL